MFESIQILKKRLTPENLLEVTHGDYSWLARFEWQPPIEDITIDKKFLNCLPKDFLSFISQITNGCILYYDNTYGQWGYKIYSTDEIISKQGLWKISLGEKWQKNFIAFSELFGEARVLLFDLNLPTKDSSSFVIKEGNPYDKPENWPIVSRSFHEWIDHLITAQGAKFWEWK